MAFAALLLSAVLPSSAVAGGASPASPLTAAAASASASGSADPINYAVAVDESESLGPGDLDREKDAVSAIAVSDPSSESRMVVFGFADAETEGQSAIDEVCPMRRLDAVGREKISECSADLRRRTKKEGTGTDFISAVRQGVTRLKEAPDPGLPRVLFLLTDGKLDVSDSYRYKDLDARTRDEQAAEDLKQALREAADAKVQIWPLGFGGDVNKEALDAMAAGGYQNGCLRLPQAKPRAAVVPGAEELGRALEAAFAAARCLYREAGSQGRPPADLKVRISPLATEGTIVVSKGDPKVTATYYDPDGNKITESGGGDGGATFEFAGRGKSVESLRITRPLAGEWRVSLDAPEGHRDRIASISVLWRGAVRSDIRLEKPSPRAGQRTGVEVEVLTRDNVKLDRRDLRGIAVSGQLTGKGFQRKIPITFTDDGEGADKQAADGVFSGTVTVPEEAAGSLVFSSRVNAVGLSADARSYPTSTAPVNAEVDAVLDVPRATVHPGGHVTGVLKVSNRDSATHSVRLALAGAEGIGLSVSPAEVAVEPDTSRTVEITVGVAAEDGLGAPVEDDGTVFGGKVTATDGERVLDDAPLDITVVPPPSIPERIWAEWWKVIIPSVVLLAVLAAALASHRRIKRLRIAPGGLLLELRGTDSGLLASQKAKAGRGNWYEFDIVGAATDSPRIERRTRGTYAVRRGLNGGAVVRVSGQGEQTVHLGEPLLLTDALALQIAEGTGRKPSGGRRSGAPRGGRVSEHAGTARSGVGTPSRDPYDSGGGYSAGMPDPAEHPDL